VNSGSDANKSGVAAETASSAFKSAQMSVSEAKQILDVDKNATLEQVRKVGTLLVFEQHNLLSWLPGTHSSTCIAESSPGYTQSDAQHAIAKNIDVPWLVTRALILLCTDLYGSL
jgi:hypothetical protein